MTTPTPPSKPEQALGEVSEQALGALIVQRCLDAGFVRAGIASLEPVQTQQQFRHWIAQGQHSTMDWLADTMPQRLDPATMLPGARAAVVVADLYSPKLLSKSESSFQISGKDSSQRDDPAIGRIARYAQGRDYHDLVKKRLRSICDQIVRDYPGTHSRVFADTAPVHERDLANRAGLGWTGKHTLTLHHEIGSYFVLGGFFTTLSIAPPPEQQAITDHCGTCTRCIDACPTNAITPYAVNASRCISYLTIEHEGVIEPTLTVQMGQWFAGCDICQEVCPHNRPTANARQSTTTPPHEGYTPRRSGFDLLEVLGWDEPTRRARFATSAMKRITLAQAQRNAIINAANAIRSGRLEAEKLQALRNAIEDLAWDATADESVRTTARQMLQLTRA